MKAFFKDVFEYHHHFNQTLVQELIAHASALPERTIPLFCHSINAQQIWNARIAGLEELGAHQIHTLEACKRIDEVNYRQTLDILAKRELNERITYTNTKGREYTNSIEQILFHVANHFSHHRGQIVSDFRQSGMAPIVTDYIFYKR